MRNIIERLLRKIDKGVLIIVIVIGTPVIWQARMWWEQDKFIKEGYNHLSDTLSLHINRVVIRERQLMQGVIIGEIQKINKQMETLHYNIEQNTINLRIFKKNTNKNLLKIIENSNIEGLKNWLRQNIGDINAAVSIEQYKNDSILN